MIGTVSVVEWDRELDSAVDAFVASHPDGLIYFTPVFLRLLREMLGVECCSRVAIESGRITGVMPVCARDGPFGTVLNSLPFFGSNGGILAANEAAELALRLEYERLVESRAAAATWVSHPFLDVTPPQHDVTDERVAQWTELQGSAASPLESIEPSARRNAQKAAREGVTVRESADALPFLECTHRENMQCIGGTTKPLEFFTTLPAVMTYGRDWRLYVAEYQQRPIAALLTFEAARTVEYVMPAVTPLGRNLEATAAILSRALTEASARGFTRWNWGGTWLTQQGVYRFKRKWGARERRYKYYSTVNDRSLWDRSPAELSNGYPWFYVLPYGRMSAARSS